MQDLKPMPRPLVAIAGGLILLLALIGLYVGGARGKGSRYSDADVADVVQTRPVPNAQALTAPPVSETDVRKWAREEAQAVIARPVAKKAASADDSDASSDTGDVADTPPAPPSASASPTPAKTGPQTASKVEPF